jgi:hypothetical protein
LRSWGRFSRPQEVNLPVPIKSLRRDRESALPSAQIASTFASNTVKTASLEVEVEIEINILLTI